MGILAFSAAKIGVGVLCLCMLHPRDPCLAKPLTLDWDLIFADCTALRWSADGFSVDGQHCIMQVRSAGKIEDQQYECISDRPCLMPNS